MAATVTRALLRALHRSSDSPRDLASATTSPRKPFHHLSAVSAGPVVRAAVGTTPSTARDLRIAATTSSQNAVATAPAYASATWATWSNRFSTSSGAIVAHARRSGGADQRGQEPSVAPGGRHTLAPRRRGEEAMNEDQG